MPCLAEMFCLILWIALVAGVQTLSIDSQLGTSVEDCFDRILIAGRLPPNAIYRNESELSARECELLCKQDKQCQSFDYGVGAKGNATCNLSNLSEKEIKGLLQSHPDYDVYVRLIQCEQPPPHPIQDTPVILDEIHRPVHRPVIRPVDDDIPNVLLDELLNDSRPFESSFEYLGQRKPEYQRPFHEDHTVGYNQHNPLRPDPVSPVRPLDQPVAYGDHHAQDTPFRPLRPLYNSTRPKPDPHDEFHFQGYRPDLGYWKPAPYSPYYISDIPDNGLRPTRPNKPYYRPDNHYFSRPNKLPFRPNGYRPEHSESLRPDPIDHDFYQPYGPIGPDIPYRPEPLRPVDKPQENRPSNNPDNHIYLEIHDPPYKPVKKPLYIQNNYGSHESSGYETSGHQDQGPISQIHNYYDKPIRPPKPLYPDNGYIHQNNPAHPDHDYGYQKPNKPKPTTSYPQSSYGNQHLGSGSHIGYPDQSNQDSGYYRPKPTTNRPQSSYGDLNYGSDNSYGDQTHQNDGYLISDKPKPTTSRPYGSYGYQETYKPSTGYQRPSSSYTTSSYGYQIPPAITSRPNYYETDDYPDQKPNRPDFSSYGNQNYGYNVDEGYKNTGNYSRPKPVYEVDKDRPDNVPNYIVRPNGDVVTSRPVVIGDHGDWRGNRPASYKVCFRRVLAGKRVVRSHVRRVINCERLEDCRRECATERRFHCESFNYRLDPSFRGKGLCELMTKPIEAFDIHSDIVEDKDFDFYELDRNSLEPNCPDNLKGPGQLHSGYLSSKPANTIPGYQKRWDMSYGNHGYGGYRRQGGHGGYGSHGGYDPLVMGYGRPSRRRHQEPFIPYQIGQIGRSDDHDPPSHYGSAYSYNSYYKDRKDYANSVDYWQLPDRVKSGCCDHDFDYHSLGKTNYEEPRPNDYGSGFGHWKKGTLNKSVWSGLDYGESNYYRPKSHGHGIHGHISHGVEVDYHEKDCSSIRRPGMSLGSGAIRRSLLAQNVVDCETACFNEHEFKCVSYSYRYSNIHNTDNCFLSERPYVGEQLLSDSGSDVYGMPLNQGCGISSKPYVESECFWHVRSGTAVYGPAVKAALTVTGLGACEAECIRAQGFFCRGFSFRFDSPTIGDDLENCILTSLPPTTLDPHSLRPTKGHEMYARGNYGRGCEPALHEDSHRESQCYLQYDNAAKLIGAAIKGEARVTDEGTCGKLCTDAPFRCLSFSYNNAAPPGTNNCLLSDVRLFDLQRGVDYEHSVDDWLFSFDLFNGRCWRRVRGERERPHDLRPDPRPELTGPGVPTGSGYVAPSGPYAEHGPPSGPSGPPAYLPEPPPPSSTSGFKPAYPPPEPEYIHPVSAPGYVPPTGFKPGYDTYRPTNTGPKPPVYPPSGGHKPYPIGPGYEDYKPGYLPNPGYGSGRPLDPPGYLPDDKTDEPISVSWRHYTVSGFPCRSGTSCAQNKVAGHWACEPEGGEIGSWDYCCAPTHRCGYSEGFHKPWCYVGPEHDQWRPCSEKYYPYHQHNVPHPSQGGGKVPDDKYSPHHHHRPQRPWSGRPEGPGKPYIPDEDLRKPGPYLPEEDRQYWDNLYKNGPQAYYDQYGNPLPGEVASELGYVKVPTEGRPHIRYHHNQGPQGTSQWQPIASPDHDDGLDPPIPGGLGVARYWPVAYLHKGPPPNMTYFKYNETDQTSTESFAYLPNDKPRPGFNQNNLDINTSKAEGRDLNDDVERNASKTEVNVNTTTTTPKSRVAESVKEMKSLKNDSNETSTKISEVKKDDNNDNLKGISGKLDDFSSSIEILDIEDAKKGEKQSGEKTLEAEERQIEAIGRLFASRRDGKLLLEKRSQKDLESQSVTLDKDLINFDFGNKFPTERKGTIQKVTKEELDKDRYSDKSLEVSETTFVRPPRVLSTTDNIRKALVNGKIFYDATIRDNNREAKTRQLEDSRAPSVLANQNGRKKNVRARNANPVRRVRRLYRRKYNPEEVRRRLLEREKNKQEGDKDKP